MSQEKGILEQLMYNRVIAIISERGLTSEHLITGMLVDDVSVF